MKSVAQTPKHRQAYTVAVVDDEPILLDELGFQLRRHGFKVALFSQAADLYRHLAVNPGVVAVLDIGLPGEDGLSVCRYLREYNKQLGIVFLTARGQRDDRIKGLAAGADAYLSKPVDLDELILTLERLGERMISNPSGHAAPVTEGPVHVSGWKVDLASARVVDSRTGAEVALTVQEMLLLRALIQASPGVCSTEALGEALGMSAQTLDKHRIEVVVSRLRTKISRQTGKTFPLAARRGAGYYLDNES